MVPVNTKMTPDEFMVMTSPILLGLDIVQKNEGKIFELVKKQANYIDALAENVVLLNEHVKNLNKQINDHAHLTILKHEGRCKCCISQS